MLSIVFTKQQLFFQVIKERRMLYKTSSSLELTEEDVFTGLYVTASQSFVLFEVTQSEFEHRTSFPEVKDKLDIPA
jgi:hypothetical protein